MKQAFKYRSSTILICPGTLAFTVNVNDVNDETPSCTKTLYTASLLETATAGDTVVTLACTDDDDDPAGLNNDLTYSIGTLRET